MVSIVVHGIMGTAYRQDIVVDGGAQGNGDVNALRDLKRHISTQYGDGTPTTGWAISPAPSGMWLSRVERAFDANYAPAYLMVSVLVPRGQRLKDDTILNKMSRAMILNHSKYINQNVIQHECDWSFLKPLSQEIEGCLEPFDGVVSNYSDSTGGEVAYYEGDLSKMMRDMWSDKFARYGTVFCGRGLLSNDKEYPVVEEGVEVINKKEERITTIEEGVKDTSSELAQQHNLRVVNETKFEPGPVVYGPPKVRPIDRRRIIEKDITTVVRKETNCHWNNNGWWIMICGVLAGLTLTKLLLENSWNYARYSEDLDPDIKVFAYISWFVVYSLMMFPLIRRYMGKKSMVRIWQLLALGAVFVGSQGLLLIQYCDDSNYYSNQLFVLLFLVHLILLVPSLKMDYDSIAIERSKFAIGIVVGLGVVLCIIFCFASSFHVVIFFICLAFFISYMTLPIMKKSKKNRLPSVWLGLTWCFLMITILLVFAESTQ